MFVFFGKFGVLCFLETTVLRLALLPYDRLFCQSKLLILTGPATMTLIRLVNYLFVFQ